MGSPGKVKRALSQQDIDTIAMYATRYAGYKEIYRTEATERGENVDWSNYEG
jgi:hypothetical protein